MDSNVLVYAVDGRAEAKHRIANQIVLASGRLDCLLTFQSVSEFYWAVSRKRIVPVAQAAERAGDWLTAFQCIPATEQAIRTALSIAATGRAAYWDALLVATAAEARCTFILSENMADSAVLAGVQIHNPFTTGDRLTELTRQLLEL